MQYSFNWRKNLFYENIVQVPLGHGTRADLAMMLGEQMAF